jgi:hypothetical protein
LVELFMADPLLPSESWFLITVALSLSLTIYWRQLRCHSREGALVFAKKHRLSVSCDKAGLSLMRGRIGGREFCTREKNGVAQPCLEMSLKPRCKVPEGFIAEEVKSSECKGQGVQRLVMKDHASRCLRFAANSSQELDDYATDKRVGFLQSVLPYGVAVREGCLTIRRDAQAAEQELEQACHILLTAVQQLEQLDDQG